MAAPAIREVPTITQATNAAVTVNLSAAVQAGDTIIVFHGAAVNITYANLDRDPTTGSWTVLGTHTFQLGTDSPQIKGAYGTLGAGGAQSFTFATEGATVLHNFAVIVLAGTATLDTVTVGDGFTEGVHAAPSTNSTTAAALGLSVIQSRSGTSADYSVQGDWTMRSEITGTAPMALATKVLTASGATGTVTFTQAGGTWDEFKAVTSVWTGVTAELRDVAESFTAADSVARAVAAGRPVAETFTATDSVTGIGALIRSVADTFTAEDSVTDTLALGRADAETFTASDSVTGTVTMARPVAETFTASDSVADAVAAARATADTFTAEDAAVGTPTYSVHGAETFTAGDSVSRQLAVALAPGDAVAFGDYAIRANIEISATVDETVGAEDTNTSNAALVRTAEDSFEAVDTVDGNRGEGRLVADTMTADNTVARVLALGRAPTELIQVAAAAIVNQDHSAGGFESFVVGDVADRAIGYVGQVVHDAVTFDDAATSVQHAAPIRAMRSHVTDTTRTAVIVDSTEVAA